MLESSPNIVYICISFFSVIYVEHKHNSFSVNGTNCFVFLHILTNWFLQVADPVSRPSNCHLKASVEQTIIVVILTFQGLVICLFFFKTQQQTKTRFPVWIRCKFTFWERSMSSLTLIHTSDLCLLFSFQARYTSSWGFIGTNEKTGSSVIGIMQQEALIVKRASNASNELCSFA